MTLHYLVKTAATANYHSTSGRSWKTTKPIQKGMKEVMMGIITLLTSIIWFIFRSEEHTSELQSRETISYAVFCLKKKNKQKQQQQQQQNNKTKP